MKLGLVLGGGGSRGAYQVGVLKALKELGIKFDVGTGTSVGAINITILAEDKIELLEEIWRNLSFEGVLEPKLKWKDHHKEREALIKSLFCRGYPITPLKNLLYKYISKKELEGTTMRVGVVYTTGPFGFFKYNPIELTQDTPFEPSEYVIASCSAFPFLKKHRLGNQRVYDGFFSDNLPVKLAIELGAEKIFAVDIMKGRRQKPQDDSVEVFYLQPSQKHRYFLNFNNDHLNELIDRGYADVMAQKDEILAFLTKNDKKI